MTTLKKLWLKTKQHGETGIGLSSPGDVLAYQRVKCRRFEDLDKLFSAKQPPLSRIEYYVQTADESADEAPEPSTAAISSQPSAGAPVPPAATSPQPSAGAPVTDPNSATVGDTHTPDLRAPRRRPAAPRSAMGGFVKIEKTLLQFSEAQLDLVRENRKLKEQELEIRRQELASSVESRNRNKDINERKLAIRLMEAENRRMEAENRRMELNVRDRELKIREARERRRERRLSVPYLQGEND